MNREQLKKLIRESVDEVINEMGVVDYEPMDSAEDHVGEWLNDLKYSLKTHLEMIDKDQDPNGDHYDGMIEDAEKVHDFIENRNISQEEKDIVNNDSELESLLGRVHRYRGSSSGEKPYVGKTWEEAISSGQLEEDLLTEKAPPGMESWVKANKERFIKKYGKKKGIGVLYATAWKMFYKNKKRVRSVARRSGE